MHSLLCDLFPELVASSMAQGEPHGALSLSSAPASSLEDAAWPDYSDLIYSTHPLCAAPEATLIGPSHPDPCMLAPWSIPLPQSVAPTLPPPQLSNWSKVAIPRVKSEKADSDTVDTTASEAEAACLGAAQGAWAGAASLPHSHSLPAPQSQIQSQPQSQLQSQSQSQPQPQLVSVLVESAEGGQLFKSPPRRGRKFKGVRHRKWGKFVCEIRDAMGGRIWLGSFDREEDAARVYDMAARILQGPGAWLNFPAEAPGPVTLPRGTLEQLIKHRGNTAQRLRENAEKQVQKRAAAAAALAAASTPGAPGTAPSSEAQPCQKKAKQCSPPPACSSYGPHSTNTSGVPDTETCSQGEAFPDAGSPWVDLAGWLDECEKEGSLGWEAVCSELLGQEDGAEGPSQEHRDDACTPLQRSQSDQCSSTSMYDIFQ